jgi:hypothetical protein
MAASTVVLARDLSEPQVWSLLTSSPASELGCWNMTIHVIEEQILACSELKSLPFLILHSSPTCFSKQSQVLDECLKSWLVLELSFSIIIGPTTVLQKKNLTLNLNLKGNTHWRSHIITEAGYENWQWDSPTARENERVNMPTRETTQNQVTKPREVITRTLH